MDAAAIATLIQTLLQLLEKFGGWAVLILLSVIGLWWIKPWAEKFFNAHIGLIETMKEESPKATVAMEKMSEAVTQLAQSRQGERDALHHASKALEDIPDCPDRRKLVKVHTQNMRESLQ